MVHLRRPISKIQLCSHYFFHFLEVFFLQFIISNFRQNNITGEKYFAWATPEKKAKSALKQLKKLPLGVKKKTRPKGIWRILADFYIRSGGFGQNHRASLSDVSDMCKYETFAEGKHHQKVHSGSTLNLPSQAVMRWSSLSSSGSAPTTGKSAG
jgi:hypothetical protein